MKRLRTETETKVIKENGYDYCKVGLNVNYDTHNTSDI